MHKIRWMLYRDEFLFSGFFITNITVNQWTSVLMLPISILIYVIAPAKKKQETKLIPKKMTVSNTNQILSILGEGEEASKREDVRNQKCFSLVMITFLLCDSLWVLPLIFEPKFISGPHTPGDISPILL